MLHSIHFAPVLIMVLSLAIIHCKVFEECVNEKLPTYLPVAENCSQVIYCNGINSGIVTCDAENPYFSAKDKMCYKNMTVCDERFTTQVSSTTVELSTTTTERPTSTVVFSTTTSGAMVSSTFPTMKPSTPQVQMTTASSTTQTAYTSTTSAFSTPTIASTIGNPSTIWSTSTTTQAITSATAPPTPNGLSCPLHDDPQRPLYLPHPQSCSQYYLCYHGTPIVMQCPHMLLFDVLQQSCNAADLVNCQVISQHIS